jgi:enoyl-CoA hydratase/carnithine racemase
VTDANSYRQILVEKHDRVTLLTLNRPDRLNAWTWRMNAEIASAIESCNDDPGVGCIVLTGAGRGFCAGADMGGFDNAIKARDGSNSGDAEAAPPRREPTPEGFYQAGKPIIAAINGPAIGVGLTMTLTMDLRIASDKARMAMRFVRMGIVPEASSSLYLPQIVGIANALELSLTGRIISADDALRYGLVNRVVPHDDLMTEAMALANEIAANPTDATWAAKRLLHRNMVETDKIAVVQREGAAITKQYESAGHKEAVRAFIEKREPKFNQP